MKKQKKKTNKIGRNDPCPCGSGKKYKNCHLDKDTAKAMPQLSPFEQLATNSNANQLLGFLAALQLFPTNHGRNVRFEQMVSSCLKKYKKNDDRPLTIIETLKATIENYTNGSHLEDPLTNAFTEIAFFENGNYIVYPGIYAGETDVVNDLTECIFLHNNTLPEAFIDLVRNAVGLLLFLSKSAASTLGHKPFIYEKGLTGNIEFPDSETIEKSLDAVYFSKDYLRDICSKLHYDYDIINHFLVNTKDAQGFDDTFENPIVNRKPLLELRDGILLYMPTGIVHSLVDFIYGKSKEFGCYEQLLQLMYNHQFHNTCVGLSKMSWVATDITLPPKNPILPIEEIVFQFDNEKFGYVCLVKPHNMRRPINDDLYAERTSEVIAYLNTLNSDQTFKVFCLYVVAEVGVDFIFMWSKPDEGNQSLALKYRELLTIAYSDDVDILSLWKFAKCYHRTSELSRIMSIGGNLDAYAAYRSNHSSLLDAENENPTGGMLIVVNGSSNDFVRQVQKSKNEHTVPILYNGQRAFAKVSKHRDFAPVFVERYMSRNFSIVLEGYKMPIWLKSEQTPTNGKSFAADICDAIAFWLDKMKPELSAILNDVPIAQFQLSVIVDEGFLKGGDFEKKKIQVENVNLDIKIAPPSIIITVPFDFLYIVQLADNTADKLLMKAVLLALKQFVDGAGRKIDLDENTIDKIIEVTLQPSQAKMLLTSDVTVNIKVDDRNLPPMRYMQDGDITYVLDNLVSYLPSGYQIDREISETVKKIQLCDDLVTGLIEQIRLRIEQFDGKELIEFLIKLNERCVQVKEFREILVPAKIACFSDIETERNALLADEKDMVITAHSLRTLIEFVAVKIPNGTKWPNMDDVDELLALTNQLTDWGAQSEAMRMRLDDPPMGILPSGRIGTGKDFTRDYLKPYASARTETEIFRHIEKFEQNYAYKSHNGEAKETPESLALDTAFKAEFGITFTNLCKIVGALINEGFPIGEACVIRPQNVLLKILESIEGVTSGDVQIAFEILTLISREAIGKAPTGYGSADIFPWRYSRVLSYLRRPLVKIEDGGQTYYYFGYRHLMVYIDNLFYLIRSSKLPNPKSPEMVSYLGSMSNEKGNPFRDAVKDWLKHNTSMTVIEHEVQMSTLNAPSSLGDIDVLAIDSEKKIIYSIECKNITGGRNLHEIRVELDDYLGRDGNDRKAKVRKHAGRHTWLSQNKTELSSYVADIDEYSISSLILTADEVPLAYIKKATLPIPVKSFPFLKMNGRNYLDS